MPNGSGWTTQKGKCMASGKHVLTPFVGQSRNVLISREIIKHYLGTLYQIYHHNQNKSL